MVLDLYRSPGVRISGPRHIDFFLDSHIPGIGGAGPLVMPGRYNEKIKKP